MKKIIFTAVLFATLGFNNAPINNKTVKSKQLVSNDKSNIDSDCAIFLKLVDLTADQNLASIKGIAVKSRYFRSDDFFNSTVPIPGTVETVIRDDSDDGAMLDCLVKNYGSDETAARADFDAQLKRISACLPIKQQRVADTLSVFIHYKNCTMNIHTYKHSIINEWVMIISMEYSNFF